jgi:hypothetical protein
MMIRVSGGGGKPHRALDGSLGDADEAPVLDRTALSNLGLDAEADELLAGSSVISIVELLDRLGMRHWEGGRRA